MQHALQYDKQTISDPLQCFLFIITVKIISITRQIFQIPLLAQSWDTSDSQIISHHWTLRPLKHILKYILYIYFSLCGSTRPQFVHLIVVASPKHWEQIIVFKSDQVYRSQTLQTLKPIQLDYFYISQKVFWLLVSPGQVHVFLLLYFMFQMVQINLKSFSSFSTHFQFGRLHIA